MKVFIEKLHAIKYYKLNLWFVVIALVSLCMSCELTTEEDPTKVYKEQEEDQKSITEHLQDNEDKFSILNDILSVTGLEHLFRTYGNYTLLAPVNSAFEAYFAEKGKNSYTDFEISELRELIEYHIFEKKLIAGAFSEGIVGTLTMSLEYMVSGPSFDGSDIMFNKSSRIIAKNWISANGIIHIVDKVIEKPVQNMYNWLSASGNYTIFVNGLNETGLDEMASKSVGESNSKFFLTCFATPDSIYAKSNITSLSDLVGIIAPGETNYKSDTSKMFSFIESHFLSEILSTSDANDDQVFFGTEGGATVKFGLIPNTANLVLNYGTVDFPEGLAVNEFRSNNLTTNGIIHLMDTMYLVTNSFQRIERSFVYLDVPGLPYDSLIDATEAWMEETGYENPKGPSNPKTEEDFARLWAQQWPRNDSGEDHIPFDRTNGWLTLNAPYSGLIKFDFHRFNEFDDDFRSDYNLASYNPPFFTWEPCDDLLDITRKLPYIIPGKYKLIIDIKKGSNRPSIKNYFDGKEIGGIQNLQTGLLNFQPLELGVVEIKPDEEYHYLRTQSVTVGKSFIVGIKFIPVD